MHRFDLVTRPQLMLEDPFSGRGCFLAVALDDSQEILDEIGLVLGAPVPAVAWPGHGAWVDTGTVPEALRRWQEAAGGQG